MAIIYSVSLENKGDMNRRYYLIQDKVKYFLRILAIASHIFCISSVSIVYSSTQLNSGLVIFDRSDYFGNDVLHANGGAIEASDNKLDLHNKIILDDEGLIIQGTNPFTLSGQISGIGKLIKLGSSNLILNSFNTYRGGTLTKEGQLTLGNSAALGSGILTVEGATKLDNSHHIPLNNPIKLNADLSIEGNQNLDINGIISGAGGLHKYGTSELMLNAVNHYSGGTVLYDGRLFLGNEDVLGSGSLNVKGEAILDHSRGFTLNNAIELDADLKLAGRYLTLNGTISGAGGINKLSSAQLTLNAANSYSGGTVIKGGGKLVIGDNLALGSGALVVDKEVRLDSWQNLALKNDLHLNADLELEGSHDLMLNGIISGSKGIKKQGRASLTLKRDNSYQGGTTINEGNLILGGDTALGSGGVKLEKKMSLNSLIPLRLMNTVWVNEDLKVVGDHDLTLDGVISGSGSLSKFGMNHLMLNAANNYSGGTFFHHGILVLGNDAALGSGTLTVRGMLNRLGTTTALTLNNPIELIGELIVDGHHDLTLNGAISGEEYLNKHGEATLRLNAANRHEGGVILSGGKLLLGNSAALGSGSLMLLEKGGSLETTTALTLNNTVKLWAGKLDLSGSEDLTLESELLGPGMITKSGTGVLTLNAANHYEGGTLLSNGKLLLGNNAALGSGVLQIAKQETSLATRRALTLNNHIELNADLNVAEGSQDMTLNGVIKGEGKIIKSGSAALQLNQSNHYSGGTVLNNGKLLLGDDSALGRGALTVAGASTLATVTPLELNNSIEIKADLKVVVDHRLALNEKITGVGKIIKSGSETLSLNTDNHYSGGTVLNKGTVRLSNAKALGSGGLIVTGSATLDTVPHLALDTPIELKADLDITGRYLTLNSIISGSGGIIKSSSAPLRLNAANRYNGGTTLYDGKLLLGHPMALGQGTLTIKGAAILDNQLELALNNRIELQDDLNVMGVENLTLNAVISGTKGLTKYGQAALTLNAANTYQGDTTLYDGTLALGKGARLAATNRVNMIGAKAKWDISAAGDQRIGALTGVIGSGVDLGKNSLTFGNDKQQTFAGVISGQGGITKIGKGKAILSGTNTFTGNTTIDEGALQIGDGGTGGSLVGDIINNSLLIFNHVDNRVFSGAISGKGSLIKEGKGQLILAGNNTYTGETVVNAGVLKVVGSFPQAKVKINNGAIFQAIGTVGDLNVETGATFTTTNRTVRSTVPSSDSDLNNHLQVVGDVNFAAGSFYDVQLDEQQSDAISVTGQANVSGATLRIQAAPGAYPLEKEYEILTAEKGIKGTFANITSDLVFVTPTLRQNEHNAVLTLPRSKIPFEQLADSQNQKNVAEILNKREISTPINRHLLLLNEDSAHTAFDNLSGAVQASVHSILLANSHTIREVVTTAMHRRKAADNHQSVWGNLLASKSSLKGDSKTEGVDHRTHGLVIGSDIKLGDHWHVGIAGAVGQTFFNTDQAGSSGVIDNYNLALYGGSHLGALVARFGGAYAFHDLNLDRRIVFPGFSETVKSNYNAGTMQFWGELSYAIPTNAALFEPFFGLAHVSVQSDKFTETAGSSALMGNKDNHHVTFSTLGLRTEVAFDSFDSRVNGRGSLAWRRGWGDLASTKNLAFNDKSTDFFDVVGVPITKDALLVASGIDIKIGKKCMLEVGYTGQFAAKMKDNAISTRIKWFF